MDSSIDRFVRGLRKAPAMLNVFNPWADMDPDHDLTSAGPRIRTRQFRHYLSCRRSHARYLLIGEALGYQGGHFSGMAMTSERILLGHQIERGVEPGHVLPGLEPQRTSKPSLNPKGFSEPTATIVWNIVITAGLPYDKFVIWNVFPWHPYNPKKGLLSNRTPSSVELDAGLPYLQRFLALYPKCTVVAVGRKSGEGLTRLAVDHQPVRHPANGGAGEFRKQFLGLLET